MRKGEILRILMCISPCSDFTVIPFSQMIFAKFPTKFPSVAGAHFGSELWGRGEKGLQLL